MKISKENYAKPTPLKWKRLGDCLLGIATLTLPLASAHPVVAGSIVALMIVGKVLTEFTS